MFGHIGIGEIIVLGVIAFLLFGPEKCVAYARRAGHFVGRLKAMLDKGEKDLAKMADETDGAEG